MYVLYILVVYLQIGETAMSLAKAKGIKKLIEEYTVLKDIYASTSPTTTILLLLLLLLLLPVLLLQL